MAEAEAPRRGRMARLVARLPGGESLLRVGGKAVKVLDEKIPTIRGRPAISEMLANAKPGITVSLVSLPLSVSLALAADATPVQGIITAAWAGLTSAVFGGSHYNVVGPTGALSGILSEFSVRYGSAIQPLLAIMAGLISLCVYFLRLERYFVFIPGSVMHGFTLGVAFIISANQVSSAFGLPKLKRHETFIANLGEALKNIHRMNWLALAFFSSAYAFLYFMQKRNGKIPWSIVLAGFGIVFGAIQDGFTFSGKISTIKSQYGDLKLSLVEVSPYFRDGLNISGGAWAHVIGGASSIALVAVLETLISASIADRMTKTLFNQRAEVLSISLANLASGFTGGIPATAALARTALNIKSGATSRASGIVNAISIILLSTVFFGLFKYLPLPVVGAILLNVAIRMVEWHEVKLLYAMDKPSFVVALLSGLICVVEDPTMGIIYGALFAMVRLLLSMRSSHTMLRIYHGATTRFVYCFESIDVAKAVPDAYFQFTGTKISKESLLAAGPARNLGDKISDAVAVAGEKLGDAATTALTSVSGGRMGNTAAGKAADEEAEAATASFRAVLQGDAPLPAAAAAAAAVPLVAVYSLPAYFTYISAQPHKDRVRALFLEPITSLPDVDVVAFGLQETFVADMDALETVGTLVDELQRAGKKVYLLGFHKRIRKQLAKAHWFHDMAHGRVFPDYGSLLLHLKNEGATASGSAPGAAAEAGAVVAVPAAGTGIVPAGATTVAMPAAAAAGAGGAAAGAGAGEADPWKAQPYNVMAGIGGANGRQGTGYAAWK